MLYCILTYFLFFENCYHCTIYAIILISPHHTAGPFNFSIRCYSKYIYHFQYKYIRDYFWLLFDSIAYSANNTGKHRVSVINIHTCKCTILILGLLWFGLSHRYTIQKNTGWRFLIVLHFLTCLCEIVQLLLNTVIIVTDFVWG